MPEKYVKAKDYRIITPLGTTAELLALVKPMNCDGCGYTMQTGQHATRHLNKAEGWDYNVRHNLFCQDCFPFRYREKIFQTYQSSNPYPVIFNTEGY